MFCSVTRLLLQVLWFRGHLQDPLWLAGGKAAGLLSQQGQRPSHRYSPHCAGENRSGVCSLPGGKQVNGSVTLFFFRFLFSLVPTVSLALTQPPLALPPQAFWHSRQSSAGPVHHGIPSLFWQWQQADFGSLAGPQQAGGEEVCGLWCDAGARGVCRRVLRLQPLADEHQQCRRPTHTQ